MAMPTSQYLEPEDIRKLATFEFAPRAIAEGYLSGRHKAPVRGSSIEFREYRPYVPGDDPALVDWRVYGRTDRHYLRTYEQETNTDCHILLDSSASMGFGPRVSKLRYASLFAAALAFLVTKNRDLLSLLLFDETIRSFLPPGSTRKHLRNIIHLLEGNEPGSPTRLSDTLQRAFPLIKRRGTVVILSDFFDDVPAIFSALSPFLHRGFKVHLMHVLAPQELELEDRGLLTYVDSESGQRLIAHSGNLHRAYSKAMEEHIAALRALAIRKGVEYQLARTDTHYFTLFDRLTR